MWVNALQQPHHILRLPLLLLLLPSGCFLLDGPLCAWRLLLPAWLLLLLLLLDVAEVKPRVHNAELLKLLLHRC
jgi:hypothetical protein